MKIEKGQYIKILFRNTSSVEGTVESWENDDYVLKSSDGKSFLIIQNPKDDIMAIKIMTVSPNEEKSFSNIKDSVEVKDEVIEDMPQINDQELRIRKLAELRIMQAEIQRKIISEKLKSHSFDEIRKVEYGQPGFLKVPDIK